VKTRFLCESCGKEVPFNVEICPSCGKHFKAVKCPVCELEGSPELFAQGCPSCGYMSSSQATQPEGAAKPSGGTKSPAKEPPLGPPARSAKKAAPGDRETAEGAFGYRRGRISSPPGEKPAAQRKEKKSLLPNWVIGWGSVLLLGLLVVLLVVLLRT
jgi:hypothetical protein